MPIPPAEVRRIAALARLEFSPEEVERFSRDLSRILDYFELLQEVDTTGIEPLYQAFDRRGSGRSDEVGLCLPLAEALANAPESRENFFVVPRVIE